MSDNSNDEEVPNPDAVIIIGYTSQTLARAIDGIKKGKYGGILKKDVEYIVMTGSVLNIEGLKPALEAVGCVGIWQKKGPEIVRKMCREGQVLQVAEIPEDMQSEAWCPPIVWRSWR